jgi:hypothetical protein
MALNDTFKILPKNKVSLRLIYYHFYLTKTIGLKSAKSIPLKKNAFSIATKINFYT